MEEFTQFCENWNQIKSNICNQTFQPHEDIYPSRNQVKNQIGREANKTEETTRVVKKPKKQCNKDSKTTKRTRTTPEERKLVMNVYKNLLAGRSVETFGSGSVKRTSDLTGLPLRSVYRIRNEELIACGSIEFANTADEDEVEEDGKHDISTEGIDKPPKSKATRQKRLSLIKKKIIFHVFDTLRSEQPDSSDSAIINLTSEITGCPVRTIHRIRVEEKSEQGLQGPKVTKAKDTKKYKLSFKKYGDDIRLAIRSTIYDVQARTEFPIVKELHDAVNERLNLTLSRSTLMRLIKHLGFYFVRKEGKKHVLVEKARDSSKKTRKAKVKTNLGVPSNVKTTCKKNKLPNAPIEAPDGYGDMFSMDYPYLDMNKQYEVLPSGQYQPPAIVQHQQPMEVPCASTLKPNASGPKPKRVLAKLNCDEVRSGIKASIYDLKIRNVSPTIGEIQQTLKDKFNLYLARTTLHRHIKRAGFIFKKREGNKHILVEKPVKKIRKPQKPRNTNAHANTIPTTRTIKQKEELQRPFPPNNFNRVSSEFELPIPYDLAQYSTHEHKADYMPLDNKQYNTLVPVAQTQHLMHQEMLAHAQQRHPSNEMMRHMPPPLQPINVLQRDVEISHPRKLMTLSSNTGKSCGIQWG